MIFGFIRKKDFYNQVQESILNVITGSEDDFLQNSYDEAKEEVASYIRHRYDIQRAMAAIREYSTTAYYNIGDLVEWSETAYDATSTYATGDRVSYSDNIYEANQDINTPEAFDSAKWDLLAENESLYIAKIGNNNQLPSTAFAYDDSNTQKTGGYDLIKGWDRANKTLYFLRDGDIIRIFDSASDRTDKIESIGEFVYDEDSIDLPLQVDITPVSTDTAELGGSIQIVGFITDGYTWEVSASNYWESGDNRNAKLKQLLIDILLYHIHARIQPRNIPEIRIQRYDGGTERQTAGAIGYLKDVQRGLVQMDLPLYYEEEKGQRVMYGSASKLNWDY